MQRSAKISQNKERQQRTAEVDQNTAKDSQWGTRWWKAFRNSGTLKANCAELHRCRPTVGYCGLHTHTHTRLMALFPGLSGWAGTRKVKPIWILLKQETVSGSGISWAICKFAPRSRQITTPATHHSVFFTGRMPFLPPNQQCQSTEGNYCDLHRMKYENITNVVMICSDNNLWPALLWRCAVEVILG